MRLKITLEYFTSPGEELILVLSDGKSIAMEYVAGGRWEASLEMPSKAAELEYSFELHRGGQCVRREWGHHSVPEPVVRQGSPTAEVTDNGNGVSTIDATSPVAEPVEATKENTGALITDYQYIASTKREYSDRLEFDVFRSLA